jgi:chemotaxis methyl-accepting protein methylase
MPLDSNRVYVIPPAQHLTLIDGMIQLTEPDMPRGRRAPIDVFFRSLAATYGAHAAAVLLSGGGADGTLGIKQIKERGGLVIVQDPTEAEHDSMPRHTIATGMVDVVLPVAELPHVLTNVWRQAGQPVLPTPDQPTDEQELALLRDVLIVLRSRTNQDFNQYRQPTLLRRIGRRMQVTGAATLADYLAILRARPDEAPALLRDLLISVTNFCRDPPAWQALEQVLPQLFQGKTSGDVIRAWVVGCATGEEAYTLAMLLSEYAGTLEVREIVLFAPHNILRDPPFSRLDVITCRNLLIYIDRAMQEQILQLFHFTSTAIGTVFIDRELRIKRYTASAQALINLIESDVNRPVTHITHMLEYDQLIPDVRQVLTTATPIERELESRQQRWYLMRIQPYRNETEMSLPWCCAISLRNFMQPGDTAQGRAGLCGSSLYAILAACRCATRMNGPRHPTAGCRSRGRGVVAVPPAPLPLQSARQPGACAARTPVFRRAAVHQRRRRHRDTQQLHHARPVRSAR